MQASREGQAIQFWDRLVKMTRVRSTGEEVMKGGEHGVNVVRIQKGSNHRSFITVYCVMQQLLNANVLQWPSSVSEDGLEVSLWLMDYSLGRNGAKRLFKLVFFDEAGASRFFDAFTEALPPGTKNGQSYWKLRGGAQESDEESTTDDGGDDTFEENSFVQGTADNPCVIDDDGDEDDEAAELAGDDEVEELKRILEEEANVGESQNLFAPMYPDEVDNF